jgi:alkanesulfonate monooxygenase SsuD/methylene tetrahydromethanopterin reductase-like flavin-dependent oxidoreductase (luciferase family)
VLIGGRGEAYVLRSVAKHADYCNWGFDMTLEQHQAKWRVLQQHCEAIGRPSEEIQITHNTRVIIAEDQSRFDRMVVEKAQEAGMSPEDYRQSLIRAVAGTPEQCIERIEQYVAGGITYFFLLFPDPISTESLRLFAQQVMPHFDRR